MRGRPRIRRWAPIALALVVVAGVAFAVVGRHPDQAPARTARAPLSPDCLHIQGEELARSDRWRVIHTGDGGEFGTDFSATPVVACDVRQKGMARVRLLGMAKLTGGGEEYSVEGGPYVEGGGIGGDVVLIDTRFYEQLGNEDGSLETGYTTLYDLRHGTSTRLPGDWLQRFGPGGTTLIDHSLQAHVTPQGGLTTVYATQNGRAAPTRFGRVTTWDAGGRREQTAAVDRVAPTRAQPGDDGGLYVHRPSGGAERITTRGAAVTWALGADPKLAWRRMELAGEPDPEPVPPEEAQLPSVFSFLPTPRTGDSGDGSFASNALWLRFSPSDRARNRIVRITLEPGTGRVFAQLAQGSDDELSTLGSDSQAAIIIGRFHEQPQARRVRLVGYPATPAARAFFDLPGTAALQRHGKALIRDDLSALTDGSRLWLWSRSGGGHVYRAQGLRDLHLAIGGTGLFATDASGRARYFAA